MSSTPLKGLILAAGRGTRLRPLTLRRSKALLPLANRPLIDYPLQKLLELSVREIGIVVGDNEDELRTALCNVDAELSYIRQDEPLGLAHAVQCAAAFCGESDFILLFCDNLFEASLAASLEEWLALRARDPQCHAMLHTMEVADPRAFGVAVVNAGWVTELEEKPAVPKSKRAVLGIDFFTPRIFEMIPLIQPSARGELEITDAIAALLQHDGKVRARALPGAWFDTGTFPALIDAHSALIARAADFAVHGEQSNTHTQGQLRLPASSRLINCSITGPVIIGEHCAIVDSELGPQVSIGDNCSVESCRLRNCQLYAETKLAYMQDVDAIFEGTRRIDRDSPPG